MSDVVFGVVVYKAALDQQGLSVADIAANIGDGTVLDETEHAVTFAVASADASEAAIDALGARGLSGEDQVVAVEAEVEGWWSLYKDVWVTGMQHGA